MSGDSSLDGVVNLGFARVDSARRERCGRAEVIFGEGKTPLEIVRIASTIHGREGHVLVTRVTPDQADDVQVHLPAAIYHERARCLTLGKPSSNSSSVVVGILCAGTSDLPVAEEAAITLQSFGRRVERIHDVGVAGIHRLLGEIERVRACGVVIVVAGMEGALPSAVAGLVEIPVIAVPTSVGYGASFAGLTALLGMVNSCANGVTVTNIDNGFGAACAADAILRLAERGISA
jgi:NCAIR mutase (PurE)-related protein